MSVPVNTSTIPPDCGAADSSSLSPLAQYQANLAAGWQHDPAQQQALDALDALYWQLNNAKNTHDKHKHAISGLYLWGDVGRGKTALMDLFYDCLPEKGKLRLHFHRFMARIHNELNTLNGVRDPLKLIASAMAKECHILCFDEFFVSDIGDAMILAGLFDALFAHGITLVATSNIPIERLYENGLARHRFIACIELLQQHTHSIHLNGECDHRLQLQQDELLALTQLGNSNGSIGICSEQDFHALFARLTKTSSQQRSHAELTVSEIHICNRPIAVINHSDTVAWFDFYALCDGPRSQLDYIELAGRFETILLSGVPRLGGEIKSWIRARGTEDGTGENQAATTGERQLAYAANDDPARRFISLVDELYDQDVTLYLQCDVPLAELYQGGALSFEFRRTYSRLVEMGRKNTTEV